MSANTPRTAPAHHHKLLPPKNTPKHHQHHYSVRQERFAERNTRTLDATFERLIAEGMDGDELYRGEELGGVLVGGEESVGEKREREQGGRKGNTTNIIQTSLSAQKTTNKQNNKKNRGDLSARRDRADGAPHPSQPPHDRVQAQQDLGPAAAARPVSSVVCCVVGCCWLLFSVVVSHRLPQN